MNLITFKKDILMRKIKTKNILLIALILCVSCIASSAGDFIFALPKENLNSKIKIEGINPENAVELSAKEIDSMPIRAISDKTIKLLDKGKSKCKSIDISYLLFDFCGIDVKDADILLIDSKNKHSVILTLSELNEKNNNYTLVYEIKNKDDIVQGNFILLDKSGILASKTADILYIDKIKVNAELSVKELPKTAPEFKDLEGEYQYAKNAVSELVKMDMLFGESETEFAPQKEITRAELAKVIVDTLKLKRVAYDNRYSDVSSNDFYAPYIASVASEGIMNGYTDGTFGYDSKINRQEFATICTEIAIKTGKVTEDEILDHSLADSRFTDRDSVFGWIENSVAYLDSLGAYQYIKDQFIPLKSINKAEVAYVIYTLLFDN